VLTDIPETTISTDSVDDELVQKPRRWNITFIRNFMLVFGLLSSVFDYLTFGVLLFILHANIAQFRTGWFLESVSSATLIVLVIRSQRPFFRSKPSLLLLGATLIIVICTLLLPYTPLAPILGFQPLNVLFLAMMGAVVVLYIIAAEYVKRWFYSRATI
jgi:Mg2+-importing ATPase